MKGDGDVAQITDSNGAVEKHVAECRDCDYWTTGNGSWSGYRKVQDRLCRHIGAPGAPCDDFSITAIYDDGSESDV